MDKAEESIDAKIRYKFTGTPAKSKNDDKQYKVITLNNELTALIISEASATSDNVFDSNSTDSFLSYTPKVNTCNVCKRLQTISVSNTSFQDVSETSITDKSDMSNLSKKSYSTLDTGITNVTDINSKGGTSKVTDKKAGNINLDYEDIQKEKIAACALTVSVGSFSDPEELPGLAHLLEHMLFMGNKNQTGENDFDLYITKKGGTVNAETDCECTTFYFGCPSLYLSDIMERFVNLFAGSLFRQSSIAKERSVIESELKLCLTSDTARVEQIILSTANDNNPVKKLVHDDPQLFKNVSEETIIQELKRFSQKHYSAHRMTLAVQANLPIFILESMVSKYFNNIPNNKIPRDRFKNGFKVSFEPELFNKIYTVLPIEDTNIVKLTWILPPIINLYRYKPFSYISYLIGIEGEGSFISYMRKKLWALEIDVICDNGNGIISNSIYSILSIEITLEKEGVSSIKEVIESLFSYIELLKETDIGESIFNEIQTNKNIQFQYFQDDSPCANVQNLSKSMQYFPITDYLTGGELLYEYNHDEIMRMLNLMVPETVNIVILSKLAANSEILDQIKPWYNIKYNIKDIPSDWLESWMDAELEDHFDLVGTKSLYKESDFKLLPTHEHLPHYPQNILKDNYIELWYKQDYTFRRPLGYIYINMISQEAILLPQNKAMIDLFVLLFNLIASEDINPEITLNGVSYLVSSQSFGLFLCVEGYNFKLLCILREVLDVIRKFYKTIEPSVFKIIKEKQIEEYNNHLLKSSQLAKEIGSLILCSPYWSSVSKLNAIEHINLHTLKKFMDKFFGNLYIKCLIQGNISKGEAINISNQIKLWINYKPLIRGTYPYVDIMQLPLGENKFNFTTPNQNEVNSYVTNYYQWGLHSIEDVCMLDLIMLVIDEPLFNTLRTKEVLGYAVGCNTVHTFGVLGFMITVKSDADRFSAQYIEERITHFLKTMENILKNITDNEFNQVRESLKLIIKQADSSLKEEVERNWIEVIHGEYLFERCKMKIRCIENIKKEDLYLNFVNCLRINDSALSLRKLSIQIEGYSSKQSSVKTLQSLKSDSELSKVFVNAERFKNKLFVYPVNKKIKK